jgi:hypothetical protein
VSGEYAFAIDALKDIQFSNGYDIETSILCQLWKEYGIERISQVDLGVYQHIPGGEDHVKDMMSEVCSALKYWSNRYGISIDKKKLLDKYREEAEKMPEDYKKRTAEYDGFVYRDADEERDMERLFQFEKILKEAWEKDKTPKLLHAWKELEEKADNEKGYSYQNLKLTLRKRINKFTSKIIMSSIYIDKSDDIIQKYTSVHGS